MQIAFIAPVKAAFFDFFKILSQGMACNGHDVQIQIRSEFALYRGHASRKPEGFRQMFSAGINIPDMRNDMVDLIEQFRIQGDAKFPCDGGKMDRRVRGAADGAVHDDGVPES